MEKDNDPLHESIGCKISTMRFATERLAVASVSKPVPAKTGAELTFAPYTLIKGYFDFNRKPENSSRIGITGFQF